jgi:hypothetical protein
MTDRANNEEGTGLGKLPKWPEEARELPEEPQRYTKKPVRWAWVYAILGAVCGFLGALVKNAGQEHVVPFALGSGLATGLIAGALGLLADHYRAEREERRRRWEKN